MWGKSEWLSQSLDNLVQSKFCQFRNSRGGGWSKDGCELASHRNDTVTCECNHLTNFAVLMDPSGISSVSWQLF